MLAVLLSASPAFAHDWRALKVAEKPLKLGPLQAALPGAVRAQATVTAVSTGHPQAIPFSGTLTNLPTDPSVTYPSPTAACDPAMCAELDVDVPASAKTLYGTISWNQPSYYLELFALSPDHKIYGKVSDTADVSGSNYAAQSADTSYNKEIGNERTIPRAQFTIGSPKAGKWIIRALSVFSEKTSFTGMVAVSADPPLEFQRQIGRASCRERV